LPRLDKQMRRLGQLVTAYDFACISHGAYGLYKLDGVNVKDSLCLRLVAEGLVIAGKTEDVLMPRAEAQERRLKSNTVAVACDHLEHRVKPFRLEQGTGSQTAKADDAGLVIGNVYTIHIIFGGSFPCSLSPRDLLPLRAALCSNGKISTL